MSRINTNVQSIVAQRVLGLNNQALGVSLERLSTGLRINRGADDPAGLIASENLKAEETALGTAIKNAERANQVVSIAEGGLTEVGSLLNELEGLVTATANDAGLSAEEKEANQLQVDSILQTIDRIASATSFQGNRLLNGNLDYQVSSVNAEVDSFKVNAAKVAFQDTVDVDVIVTQSAQKGGLFLSLGAANIDLNDTAGNVFKIEVAGSIGNRELSFASTTAITDIRDAINTFSDVTGVEAAVSGTGIVLSSNEFGSDEFVKLTVVDDGGISTGDGVHLLSATDFGTAKTAAAAAYSALANGVTDDGQDVGATINGIVATTNGSSASINTDFLNVEIDLKTGGAAANAQNLGSIAAFTITGGGADFQLGPNVDIAGKVSLGIQNVAARTVGEVSHSIGTAAAAKFTLSDLGNGASLNLEDGDLTGAQKVVGQAIKDISSLRGRLGAFQKNTIGATIRSLGVSLENTTAAGSVIRDADFAAESAALTRSQILVQSSTNVLSIANSQPQNVLALLG